MGVEDETPAATTDETAAASTTEAPAAPGPAPWSKELEEFFPDADVRAKVDTYIREKRQPYVTKLEQERADLAERAAWHDDLAEDPDSVLHDAITQKYGEDAGAKFLEMIDAGATPAEAVAETKQDALDPEDRAALEFAKTSRQQQELDKYLAEVAEVKAAHPHVRDRAFHLYVKEHGTIADATAAYLEDYPAPVTDEPAADPAPPTLTGGGGSTPVAAQYASIDELGAALFAAAGGR